MKNKSRIVELDYTCERCGHVFSLTIDKDTKDDIIIYCPNCKLRNRELERVLEDAIEINGSKINELLFNLKSMFITQPILKLKIINIKVSILMSKFGFSIKNFSKYKKKGNHHYEIF